MEVIIQPTPEEAADVAAQFVAGVLEKKPDAVLGLATGNTPLGLYRRLIAMKLDWKKVTTFNIDEYVGLAPDHPQSYRAFMWANLFRHVNIAKENVHIPDGNAKNIPEFCTEYEQRIKDAGGIDLQILGIGSNGHIGFNEPTSSLTSRTRIKTLTEQTRNDNARFFRNEAEVPLHVVTMGIGTIMEARQNLLLAFGSSKARAVAMAIEGSITSLNPASALQMHPDVKVCLDDAAAQDLQWKQYYQSTYQNKPDWQRF